MDSRPEDDAGPEERKGRQASAAELRLRLAGASGGFLAGALDNPDLGEEEMILLLRNRAATSALLQRIGRDRRWTRVHEVKRGLVLHPRTPFPVARRFLDHLYWKDLAQAAEDLRVPPPVRRAAERLLLVRVAELTLGEKIALARKASRGVIPALRESGEGRVIRALLSNPRLVEQDAVSLASATGLPGDVLRALASHPTWGGRHSVRMALIRNPRTPVATALRLVERLPRQELLRLVREGGLPRIVRVRAERRIDPSTPSPRRGTGREDHP